MNTTTTRRSLTLEERAEIRADACWDIMPDECVRQHGTRELLQAHILEHMTRAAEADIGIDLD